MRGLGRILGGALAGIIALSAPVNLYAEELVIDSEVVETLLTETENGELKYISKNGTDADGNFVETHTSFNGVYLSQSDPNTGDNYEITDDALSGKRYDINTESGNSYKFIIDLSNNEKLQYSDDVITNSGEKVNNGLIKYGDIYIIGIVVDKDATISGQVSLAHIESAGIIDELTFSGASVKNTGTIKDITYNPTDTSIVSFY